MAITATLGFTFNASDTRTVGISTSAKIPVNYSPSYTITDGVGALQANILYQASLALTAGVANIDLAGSLTDGFGGTITAARIKALYFENRSSTNSMTLGNGTNPWATLLNSTGTLTIPAGGACMFVAPNAAGWTVTAATGDVLKVAGTGTDSFYVLFLGGNA